MASQLRQHYKTPVIGLYGAYCIKTAITRMLTVGKTGGIAKTGEEPLQNQIAPGVYFCLLEFFPPLIMYFDNARHPEPSVSFDDDMFRYAKRCQDIIYKVSPLMRILREKERNNKTSRSKDSVQTLIVWCATAHASIEHFDLEKRCGRNGSLMPWEEKFLPELKEFFEIFYRQEREEAARPYPHCYEISKNR